MVACLSPLRRCKLSMFTNPVRLSSDCIPLVVKLIYVLASIINSGYWSIIWIACGQKSCISALISKRVSFFDQLAMPLIARLILLSSMLKCPLSSSCFNSPSKCRSWYVYPRYSICCTIALALQCVITVVSIFPSTVALNEISPSSFLLNSLPRWND